MLSLRCRERNIADVLDMTIGQAHDFFTPPALRKHLEILQRVGLEYLKLGLPIGSSIWDQAAEKTEVRYCFKEYQRI